MSSALPYGELDTTDATGNLTTVVATRSPTATAAPSVASGTDAGSAGGSPEKDISESGRLRRRSAVGLGLRLATLAVAAATNLLIARSLGVSGFGTLSLGISILGMVVQLADFGMTQAVTRLVSERPRNATRIANAATSTAFVANLVLAAIACGLSVLAYNRATAAVVAVLLAAAPLASTAVLAGVATARGRPDIAPLISLVQAALGGCVATVIALAAPSALLFGIGTVIATASQAALYVCFATDLSFRPCFDRELTACILRYSWPIGVLGVFVTAYYRLDSVIVFESAGPHALGLYSAGYRFVDIAQVLPAAIVAPLIPLLVQALSRSQVEATRILTFGVRWAAVAGAGVGAVIVGCAPALLDVAFGPTYLQAAHATVFLGLAFVPICIGYVFTTACVANGGTARQLLLVAPLAVLSLGAQLVFIPVFGIAAAAAATLVTEVGATLIAWSRVRGTVGVAWRDVPVRSISGAFAVAAGVGYLSSPSWWSIVVAAASFVLTATALGAVRLHDVTFALGFVASQSSDRVPDGA